MSRTIDSVHTKRQQTENVVGFFSQLAIRKVWVSIFQSLAKNKYLLLKNSNPNPKYLGCGYKGLVFCRNNGWIMENIEKELTVQKRDADILAKKAQKFICPICLPRSSVIQWKKASLGVRSPWFRKCRKVQFCAWFSTCDFGWICIQKDEKQMPESRLRPWNWNQSQFSLP